MAYSSSLTSAVGTTTRAVSDDDIELNTGHVVFADINGTPGARDNNLSDEKVVLGKYRTVKEFWEFWNAFQSKRVLFKLPTNVNVRISRDIVRQTVEPEIYSGSTWSADMRVTSDERMMVVIIEIAALLAAEQLSALANCVTFDRREFEGCPSYRVYIWLHGNLHETFAHLEHLLHRYSVESTFETTLHISETSGRIHRMPERAKRTKMDTFVSYRQKVMNELRAKKKRENRFKQKNC